MVSAGEGGGWTLGFSQFGVWVSSQAESLILDHHCNSEPGAWG